jgi:hypothetical protein
MLVNNGIERVFAGCPYHGPRNSVSKFGHFELTGQEESLFQLGLFASSLTLSGRKGMLAFVDSGG